MRMAIPGIWCPDNPSRWINEVQINEGSLYVRIGRIQRIDFLCFLPVSDINIMYSNFSCADLSVAN